MGCGPRQDSHATRTLAERSAPPGVRPARELMVALDGAIRGQVGSIHGDFSCSSLRRRGTSVSDCVLGNTARDISGSNPSRSTRKSARAAPGSRSPQSLDNLAELPGSRDQVRGHKARPWEGRTGWDVAECSVRHSHLGGVEACAWGTTASEKPPLRGGRRGVLAGHRRRRAPLRRRAASLLASSFQKGRQYASEGLPHRVEASPWPVSELDWKRRNSAPEAGEQRSRL